MANLDEIRRHIAEELTPSQRERGKYICPLCGSGSHGRNSTAAFSIDRDGVHGKCFSCDFYGDIFDLVAQRDGLTLEAATRQLVDKYEPGARRERSSAAADFAPAPPPISSGKAEAPAPAAKSVEVAEYIRRAHSHLKGSDGERYLLGRGLILTEKTERTLRKNIRQYLDELKAHGSRNGGIKNYIPQKDGRHIVGFYIEF